MRIFLALLPVFLPIFLSGCTQTPCCPPLSAKTQEEYVAAKKLTQLPVPEKSTSTPEGLKNLKNLEKKYVSSDEGFRRAYEARQERDRFLSKK